MATLRQLKAFVTTAEHKKMSEAAKHLYVSQPTISQIIADLEKEYGTTLFERHSKELIITPAGRLLLQKSKEIIAIYEMLEQNMKTISTRRPLRIGATMTVGTNIIGKIIQNFEQQHPDIDTFTAVHNTNCIEEMLLLNELDVAIVEGIIDHEEILTFPVFDDTLCIICGMKHPFYKKDIISPEELHNHNFILREKGSGTRSIFEQRMRFHNIPYKVKWESNSTAAIADAVSRNIGLGFVSTRCVTNRVLHDNIYICPVQGINLKRSFYLCHLKYHPITTQMQDFMNYIHSLPSDYN